MRYLLDTNIVIAALKGNAKVREKLEQIPLSDLVLSPVVLGELELGVEKSQYKDRNRARLAQIVEGMPSIPLDSEASRQYGMIRGTLERSGTPIGANDYWIAAHALATGSILVTHNLGELSRVSGLKLENWLE